MQLIKANLSVCDAQQKEGLIWARGFTQGIQSRSLRQIFSGETENAECYSLNKTKQKEKILKYEQQEEATDAENCYSWRFHRHSGHRLPDQATRSSNPFAQKL